jgi:hypothetical protein
MVDLSASVKAAIEAAGYTPEYAYPQAWNTVPVISFWESQNNELDHADDAELLSTVQFNIDIWAETPEETHAISAAINTQMQAISFRRTGCYDLYEGEVGTGLHHRNMVFETTAKYE